MSDKPKKLLFEEEARDFLLKGINQLHDVVGVTLGPKGKNVGLDTSWGPPKMTNDASSIVSDITLKNQYENMGASIGKDVAAKMKASCGDGTATAIILLAALVQQGVKNIASGSSPILVKRGMDQAVACIAAHLVKSATPVQDMKEIEKIATASASGEHAIGEMLASAFDRVGKEGVISIEEGKGTETTLEMVEGMQLDRGYASPYFSTDSEKMACELNKPRILVTDHTIRSVQEILPLLQTAAQTAQELLIIADDIESDALSTLVLNRLRGTLKVCAIKAPGFGDRKEAMLADIAILTGATYISEKRGTSLKDVDSMALGTAEKVVATKDTTTILSGGGSPSAIQERVKQIQSELEQATSSYDREKLQERKAKLSRGIAVIRVGAPTEPAMEQQKRLYQDSLNSTRAAIEEGVIVGGGIALLRAAIAAERELSLPDEEAVGARIVLNACRAPFSRLVENAGLEPSLLLEEVMQKGGAFGCNVETGKIEDLMAQGVRDPLKMVRHGLQFAASAAGTVLLSECLIGEAEEGA